MNGSLVYELHKLTRLLDRAADSRLREREGLSYSRFLALFAVRQGAVTQRDVARWLGQSEPATSHMVGLLASDGLLDVLSVPGKGHRRQLGLTELGRDVVERCARFLDGEFEELMARSAVRSSTYQRETRRLLAQLESDRL